MKERKINVYIMNENEKSKRWKRKANKEEWKNEK